MGTWVETTYEHLFIDNKQCYEQTAISPPQTGQVLKTKGGFTNT